MPFIHTAATVNSAWLAHSLLAEGANMNPATAKILDFVADSFNPLLVLLALIAPRLAGNRSRRQVLDHYAATGVGVGLVYLVKALDGWLRIWAAFGLDFSTHSAVAASLVVSLAVFRRGWLAPLAIALALYYALELVMGYHGVPDILSAGTLAALLTGAAHWMLRSSS